MILFFDHYFYYYKEKVDTPGCLSGAIRDPLTGFPSTQFLLNILNTKTSDTCYILQSHIANDPFSHPQGIGGVTKKRMECHFMMLDSKGFVRQLKSEVPGYPYDVVECFAQTPKINLVCECNSCLLEIFFSWFLAVFDFLCFFFGISSIFSGT